LAKVVFQGTDGLSQGTTEVFQGTTGVFQGTTAIFQKTTVILLVNEDRVRRHRVAIPYSVATGSATFRAVDLEE
jgi:hypothetical protein